VQYRWMYHIESTLKKLRAMVGNKRRVEGCIAEEFKYKEIASLIRACTLQRNTMSMPLRCGIMSMSPLLVILKFFNGGAKL
jgi:hypothetical protein